MRRRRSRRDFECFGTNARLQPCPAGTIAEANANRHQRSKCFADLNRKEVARDKNNGPGGEESERDRDRNRSLDRERLSGARGPGYWREEGKKVKVKRQNGRKD